MSTKRVLTKLYILDSFVTNRITKKYLQLDNIDDGYSLDDNIENSRIRRKQKLLKPKISKEPNKHKGEAQAGLKNSTENGGNMISNKENTQENLTTTEVARNEVVRYVPIPSSFPHFPRLSNLYASSHALSGNFGKNHSSIPRINNQKKVRRRPIFIFIPY